MGSSDELSSQLGTGNRESGSDIRLEYYDRTHEDKSLPFFGRDEVINEILRTTPHLSASLEEIKDYYERNPDNKDRTEYIKSIFNNDYTELTLEDGRTVGYKTFENVLHLWEGKYDSRTAQSYYDWAVIARHFEAMRLLGELSDSIKPLPSMDGQMTFILEGRAEGKKTSAFVFSQEIIDAVLANGSGFSEGKMRIYEQFEKSLSAKENADFLKNEYGWGGSYPVIIGAGIDESHDGKGITITKGIGKEKPHITLSWSQVEKRIGELIRTDRYLNPKEKEHYPQWLESQEERRAKIEEMKRNREILSNAPPEQEVEPTEKEPEEAEQPQDVEYEYHLGDKVYIGASEYEILSVDDERVMLYDYDMSLKEYIDPFTGAANDIFAENAWYFRNALVRANYTNLQMGVYETTEYLEAFLRNLLLNEKNELHNRNLHISGLLNEEKVNIEDKKVDIESRKVDIQDKKVDIESVLTGKVSNFSVKTTTHIRGLFEKFGFDEIFGRSAVMELLDLKGSGASKLLSNLVQAEIIEPVSGHGKGKYKFRK